jgi:hypothetical protein
MSENREIRIDFYQVTTDGNTNTRFKEILENTHNISDDEQRIYKVNNVPIRLESLEVEGIICQGEITRIRMDQIPEKANLQERGTEPILLTENEGLSEATAFLYDSELGILVIQRTQSGVSVSAFQKYFQNFANSGEKIELSVVLEPYAIRKLHDFTLIKKLEISVAGLRNLEIFNDVERANEEITALTNAFQSPSLNLILSVQHEKESSLKISKVIECIQGWLHINSTNREVEVSKISVNGLEDEDSPVTTVDLLGRTIREKTSLNLVNRMLPYSARKQAIKKAWEKRRDDLLTLFQEQGE